MKILTLKQTKLTKEQAIKGHRELWNWIAEQKENGDCRSVFLLKDDWCYEHGFKDEAKLLNYCFCCEYNRMKCKENGISYRDTCEYCPLIWGTEGSAEAYYCENGISKEGYNRTYDTGLWEMAQDCVDNKKCAELCRQIANLEEKNNV